MRKTVQFNGRIEISERGFNAIGGESGKFKYQAKASVCWR